MGRHSKPDPEDSPGGDFGDRHDEPQTERFGHFGQRPDREDAGYETDYGSDRDDEYSDEPEYPNEPDYSDAPDHTPDYAADTGSTPPPRSVRRHSGEWEGGEWTGSHRAVTPGRRGVSVGVIAALVAVVVLVGAVILWRFFGDALSDRTDQAAARCVDGELSVAVVADPNITEAIQSLANRYNETAAPVADKCVKVGVKPAESDQVVNGFIGAWPAELGDRPALWIPGSSVSAARLEASSGAQTIIDSRPLVSSPVVLAVSPQLKTALAQQNWSTLPNLQSNPTALDGLNLPGWGSLRLALPLSGDSDASYLAAEAIATASAPAGAPPSDGTRAVNTLVAGQPKLADKKTSTALDALIKASDPAAAPVHAVAITEQQLYQRTTGLPDAAKKVVGWLPPAPAAVADFPTVLLSAEGLSQEQKSAASEFARFMRKPEQLAELAKAGFRTQDGTPPDSDVVDFGQAVPAPLTVGDNESRALLASALTAPVANPAVTIMLDQSMPTVDGGRSRLENVVAALNARLQALPASAAVGLWTFDGTAGRSEVSTGPLSDQVNGQPRSAALTSALDDQSASGGGAVSFTTLRLVYTEAMANFREGQKNSILVITTGPHTDQTLNGDGLQQYIRGAFDEAKPVAVNVIDFGSDSDRATWEAVAEISGGSYQNLDSSDSPELTSAITNFLG
ncbi:substrate-binding domain-containing protein [Mycolicibacterium celeriflavum]|uniref:substrate-binding domain-containing protein n=1 Tax=Mycolicibacterium celeriflavum TaxID=1249101 RepID=UPI003CEFEEC9